MVRFTLLLSFFMGAIAFAGPVSIHVNQNGVDCAYYAEQSWSAGPQGLSPNVLIFPEDARQVLVGIDLSRHDPRCVDYNTISIQMDDVGQAQRMAEKMQTLPNVYLSTSSGAITRSFSSAECPTSENQACDERSVTPLYDGVVSFHQLNEAKSIEGSLKR